MNEERIISACFKDRNCIELLPKDLQFGLITQGVLTLLKDYYTLDQEAKSCSPDYLLGRLGNQFQNTGDFNAAWDFLDRLPSDVSLPNVKQDIQDYKKQLAQRTLTNCLAVGTDEEIIKAIDEYTSLSRTADKAVDDEEVYKNVSVSDLVNKHFTEAGTIKLWPKQLNDLVGGNCRRGHHILLFARPEIGKTLFALNMVAGFLNQKLKTVYFGNEDPAPDILLRLISRLSKLTHSSVKSDPNKAETLARQEGYENFTFVSVAPGNFQQIRRLVKQEKAEVVILDQLRNIDVYSENRVQALEKAATEARNLAKSLNVLVISLTQAGDSAEGKSILGRDDVDYSKTGIPAQVDLMVGLGADAVMEKTGYRTASAPKNKLSGKHDSFTFSIDPSTGVILNAN